MNKAPLSASITRLERTEREADRRPLNFAIIRRLMRYTRNCASKRNWLIFLVILRSIQLPALAWAIGAVVGGPVARMDVRGVVMGALGYAVLTSLTQFTLKYRSLLALELGEQVIHDVRNEMFAHLQRLNMKFFDVTKTGRTISRFTSDAEAVRVGVQDVLFVTLVGLGQIIVSSTLMIVYDRVLFLVVAAMAPILWALNVHFRKKLSESYRAVQESFSRVTATLAESVSGMRVIQGFARQDINTELFHDLVSDHSRYNVDAAKSAGVFLPMLEFNTQLFIAFILLVGGWRVLHGSATAESLYQFVLMSGVFFGPLLALGNQYNQALTAMAGAERVFRFLDTKPDWSDPPGAVALPRISGRIEFRDVGFGYEPGRPVLHDIDLTIEAGRTVALVGETGSGKSSMIKLIAKFYLPTSGAILIDGHDICTLDSDSLHAQTGIVLQENFLFTGTVMDNIRLGKTGIGKADIENAARRLGCLDVIESLPNGLMTVVGEGGSGISLGQRQLICFTRAMLADPRILILDEATSSVDAVTEERIQNALAALLHNRTSIVVAHRLSTIRHADLVCVLDEGRIVERGTHEDLLRVRGVYAGLYRQFIRSSELVRTSFSP